MYGPPHRGALQVCGREENQGRRFKYVLGTSKRGRAMKQLRTQKWVMCPSTMLILVLCLALSLSGVLVGVSAAQAAGTNVWTQLPLYGGPVSVLAINPKTPTTVYVSTERGIFRSIDSGDTWTAVNTQGLAAWQVMVLTIDPKTPTTLYAVTNGGLFRSTNSGKHWTLGLPRVGASSLIINPLTPTTLYAGTGAGIQ